MTAADIRRLFLLAALWGGSFLFIRVAVPALGPVVTVAIRVSIAGLTLLLFTQLTKKPLEFRTWWPKYVALGALNSAIPFALISFAEVHLSASVAAILNATSPLFAAVIAALWLREPLTRGKVLGIMIAISGVVVLVGWGPLALDRSTVLSIGASLLAAAFYGLGGAYTKSQLKGAPPLGMAVGSMLGASLLLTPIAPFVWPATMPSSTVLLCVLALALFSTALAYLLFFRLVVDIGPTQTLTVTFLVPIFGVLWGALFLGEGITMSKVLGCGVILLGTAFVTGILGKEKGVNRRV